jgi:CTP:phosphocholine cytidylyltransferase-like protein
MNRAQEYLINAGINDIIIANGDSKSPNDWKYLSDVLADYHMTAFDGDYYIEYVNADVVHLRRCR